MSSIVAVAFVTGAAQGIGRGVALRLADDGFDVAVNDIPSAREKLESLSEEIIAKGRRACISPGDVSLEGDVKRMFAEVVKTLGQIDVMVVNAGICSAKPILDTTTEEWDHLFAVNTRGSFLCYKYAAAQMIKQGRGGRIVGASSTGGLQGEPHMAAYCGTKFAIRGLTQVAAREWGPHKITVNVYCPGVIETEMLDNLAKEAGMTPEVLYNTHKQFSSLGYNGTPADVASVVSFLASKEAHFITGQSIPVNGGRFFV